jgi:hypothetical protein
MAKKKVFKKPTKKLKPALKKAKKKIKQEFDNNLRGVLFRNKRKKTEKQPDYTGNVEVEGVEYWLSAWTRESENGMKYMSLALTAKESDEDDEDEDDEETEDDLPF